MTDENSPYRRYRRWVTEPIDGPIAVSVVIPAYNEEWRILPTIGAIATHMSARGEPWELVIADDGSTDRTAELVEDLRFANLVLLSGEPNRGKGAAVRRGMHAARGALVLFADADQSTPIEQFDALAAPLFSGTADIVVGSRAAPGAEVHSKSLLRRFLSRTLHVLVAQGFGVTVTDTQCGFKLFTAAAAHDLFTSQRLDGFSFDLEVLYLAGKWGYRVTEVPVEWVDAPGSTVAAGKVSLQFLRDLVRIRLNDARSLYSAPALSPAASEHESARLSEHPNGAQT